MASCEARPAVLSELGHIEATRFQAGLLDSPCDTHSRQASRLGSCRNYSNAPCGAVGFGHELCPVRLPARFRSEGKQVIANKLIRLGFLTKLGASVVAFLICHIGSTVIATSVLNRPQIAPFIQLASLMILFQAIYDATNNSFIGQDLMQYSAGAQIMQALLKGTLGPVLVFIGLGITGAISAYVLALAAAGVTVAFLVSKRRPEDKYIWVTEYCHCSRRICT